jgi:hypothetical protein
MGASSSIGAKTEGFGSVINPRLILGTLTCYFGESTQSTARCKGFELSL